MTEVVQKVINSMTSFMQGLREKMLTHVGRIFPDESLDGEVSVVDVPGHVLLLIIVGLPESLGEFKQQRFQFPFFIQKLKKSDKM